MSKQGRRLADTAGSNWEPAAALGSFSCKPGPGRDCYGRDGPLATGQAAATTIAQLIPPHSPALTSTQQVTPHLMPELAPPPFSASIFMQLWRACTPENVPLHCHFFHPSHGWPFGKRVNLLFLSKVNGLLWMLVITSSFDMYN